MRGLMMDLDIEWDEDHLVVRGADLMVRGCNFQKTKVIEVSPGLIHIFPDPERKGPALTRLPGVEDVFGIQTGERKENVRDED